MEEFMVTGQGIALALVVLACIQGFGLTLVWLELRRIAWRLEQGPDHGG